MAVSICKNCKTCKACGRQPYRPLPGGTSGYSPYPHVLFMGKLFVPASMDEEEYF